MKLILHAVGSDNKLSQHYRRAFSRATELLIVTAYLTDWDSTLKLNTACKKFRIVVGKDYGITRKAACEAIMRWLPARRKGQFLLTDGIAGFHPKAVFWKEPGGKAFAIVGSSNLTYAAFETNYEANAYGALAGAEYDGAKQWLADIEERSVVVSEDVLSRYKEATLRDGAGSSSGKRGAAKPAPLVALPLPRPKGTAAQIAKRRGHLAKYAKHRAELMNLFRNCANKTITSRAFFETLPTYWGSAVGDRLQGLGWERKGKSADFRKLAESFVAILDAPKQDRDDVVREQIDYLHDQGVPARKAFLSEMLCLRFPHDYPVLNAPVINYLRHVGFNPPRGASEGVRYVDLARKLRYSLQQNPHHPAKNIAELDTVIWLAFGKKTK